MTYDDLAETLDELDVSGDTPIRIFYDGTEFEIDAVVKGTGDGTVHLILEEA